MARIILSFITIEGLNETKVTSFPFTSFSLSQGIFEHHVFRLICPAESIRKSLSYGEILTSSRELIGKNISIRIEATGKPLDVYSLTFKGVITKVEAARYSGDAGDIIISGFSPTILMDEGPDCKTWEEKTIKDIACDVVNLFPKNVLRHRIKRSGGFVFAGESPLMNERLLYTVQYRETAWQFLNRLSTIYGMWLFYDGAELVFTSREQICQTYGKGNSERMKEKLLYGSDLTRFNMAANLRPAKFKMMAYDYIHHEVYHSTPAGIADKAGLNDMDKTVLEKSERFYATNPKQWNNRFLTNKKQLDDVVTASGVLQSSNMIQVNGSSVHPGLKLGGIVSLNAKDGSFIQMDEYFGDYTVISINHYCDGQGNYTNDFVAIPASLTVAPANMYEEPYCETQTAFVTDNYDPDGLGRIRVRFHRMDQNEKTPWVRITSPHGGEGKGLFFIPEIGEEVMVGFEGGSPEKAYIIGTVYNGKEKTTFSNSGNDVKAIQTRSGNKVIMNDKDGSVHVSDAKGNDMMMDGKGNINVKSGESIVFTCGDSKIEMKKDGTINIKGKVVTITASDKAAMVSKGASFVADGKKNDAAMEGDKTNVNGSTEASLKGGKTNVSASGKVTVRGSIITLN